MQVGEEAEVGVESVGVRLQFASCEPADENLDPDQLGRTTPLRRSFIYN